MATVAAATAADDFDSWAERGLANRLRQSTGRPTAAFIWLINAYVEGHWLLNTSGSETASESNPLERNGILSLEYLLDKNEIKVVTTRLGKDGESPFPTESDIAYAQERGPSVRCLNYFYLNVDRHQDRGVSEGSFSRSATELCIPDRLQATVVMHKEGKVSTQIGVRILDSDVKWLARKFGNGGWIVILLKEHGATIEERVANLKAKYAGNTQKLC